MQFPTHWVRESHQARDDKGKLVTRQAYGWSSVSDAEARELAKERARRAVAFAVSGKTEREQYGYGVDPAREELLQMIVQDDDEPIAALTRNRYGAVVLNTQRVLFADIDWKPNTGGFLKRLFGKATPLTDAMMTTMRAWHSDHPSHAVRVYRTAAGFRVIFVDAQYGPTEERTFDLLRSLHADSLYVALCRRQGCFRARLTPKPWRCGLHVSGINFPYASDAHERAQRDWEKTYDAKTANYATCELLGTLGGDAQDPVVAAIVQTHAEYVLNPGKPLA